MVRVHKAEGFSPPARWSARWLWVVLSVATPACGQASQEAVRPAEPTLAPAPPPISPRPLLDDWAEPPPIPESDLRRHRGAFRRSIEREGLGDEAAKDADGEVIVLRDRARPFLSPGEADRVVLRAEPAPGATPGPLAQSHGRFFARVPTVRLDPGGEAVLRFETTRSCAGAVVYFGTAVPSDPLAKPRLRARSISTHMRPQARKHTIPFQIRRLLSPRLDVAGMGPTGRGVVTWRLEALDPAEGSSRVHDGELPFRCEPVPCREDARLVPLPSFRTTPVVDQVRPEQAVISFRTHVNTAARVLVQSAGGELLTFGSEANGTKHEVPLAGLKPSTAYRYHVLIADRRGEVFSTSGSTFRTAPPVGAEEPFTFVVLSDSRSGYGVADDKYGGTNRRVLEGLLLRALDHRPRLVVFVGDLVDGYTTEPRAFRYELEAWQRSVAAVAARLPIYEVMGNHEAVLDLWVSGWAIDRGGDESAEALFAEHVVNPINGPPRTQATDPPYRENTYSFGYSRAHFAVVNSNYFYRSHPHRADHPRADAGYREGWLTDRTLEWLDRDLRQARRSGARHLFVFTHEPGFPNGGHVQDGMWWLGRDPAILRQRARFFRILARHRVAVVFHGDEHNYSRMQVDRDLVPPMKAPVWQIISGGSGAPFYAQDQSVPWAERVAAFDARQHYVAVRVEGDRLAIEAVSLAGQRIDRFEMP